jgi:hypothetical protein
VRGLQPHSFLRAEQATTCFPLPINLSFLLCGSKSEPKQEKKKQFFPHPTHHPLYKLRNDCIVLPI